MPVKKFSGLIENAHRNLIAVPIDRLFGLKYNYYCPAVAVSRVCPPVCFSPVFYLNDISLVKIGGLNTDLLLLTIIISSRQNCVKRTRTPRCLPVRRQQMRRHGMGACS